MKVEVCLSPQLFSLYCKDAEIVLVVDIFRATSSMCVAFESGVRSIRPVSDLEEAKRLKKEGFLVGAERNVARCDFADFGNSPSDYKQEILKGKDIVMTTTNGTKAINMAALKGEVFIASFSNFSTVLDFCLQQKKNILVLCAGWNDCPNVEDSLFAGALCEALAREGEVVSLSDAVLMTRALWNLSAADPKEFIRHSEHFHRLLKYGLEDDIDFCLRKDTTAVLPYFNKEKAVLSLK